MPVKISPLKILNDLGYEMVDIESDEDYLSALMESIVSLQGAGGSGRARADILQEELIRVRKERKKAAPSAVAKSRLITEINIKIFIDKKPKPLRKLKIINLLFKSLKTEMCSLVNKIRKNKGITPAIFLKTAS